MPPVATDALPSAPGFRVALAGANPSAQTSLEVTTASPFTVTVYDALRRRLTVSEYVPAGPSRIGIDLRPWSAGMYMAVVRTARGEQAAVRLVRP